MRLPLIVVAVLVTGCAGELPPPRQLAETDYHLRLYAAAAREYETRHGEWPRQLEQLLGLMNRAPAGDAYLIDIGRISERGDGTLLIAFSTTDVAGGQSARPLRGVATVAPVADSEVPAAVVRWKYGGLIPVATGTVTMRQCALGEYAA